MREAASRGFLLASNAPFGYRRVKVSDGAKERPTLEVDPATAPPKSRTAPTNYVLHLGRMGYLLDSDYRTGRGEAGSVEYRQMGQPCNLPQTEREG